MSQQINLLNTVLIKQKDYLNPTNIAITLGLLSGLMLGYYGYAQKELSTLNAQRGQIAEELSAMNAQLKQATLLHTQRAPNKALLDEISQLEQKEVMQQQILQTINQSATSPDKGYAALMRAFAKQSMDGLWLTNFSFDNKSQKLNISGRTLQAEFVPEYISRLGNEPALKGKLFSALNMRLPKAEPTTNSTPNTATTTPNQIAATQNAEARLSEPKFIEFVLQSVDEKSSATIAALKDEKKS